MILWMLLVLRIKSCWTSWDTFARYHSLGTNILNPTDRGIAASCSCCSFRLPACWNIGETGMCPITIIQHYLLTSQTKVLCTASSDTSQNTSASRLAKNVVGLVLFGTPHANEDDITKLTKAISIMVTDRSHPTARMGEMKPVQLVLGKIASEFTSHKFSFISLNFVESEAQKYGRPRVRKMFHRSKRVVC